MGSAASAARSTSSALPQGEGNPAGFFLNPGPIVEALQRGSAVSEINVSGTPFPAVELIKLISGAPVLTKDDMFGTFEQEEDADESAWTGTYVDVFSPDYETIDRLPSDINPLSRRFVDVIDGALSISADHGDGEKWGKRFDPKTTIAPVLAVIDGSPDCMRLVNFKCTLPSGAPQLADADKGALEFLVTLGTIHGTKALKWTTLYRGFGGHFSGNQVPPSTDENLWILSD